MLLLAIHLGLLVVFALTRLVDMDEGFYLSAAKEVAQGRALYQDFFYPQMPYLPYIFSFFTGNGFDTLYYTRLASTAAAMLTAILFYMSLVRLESDRMAVRVVLALYLFSGMVLSYTPWAKTYAWTGFFLMAAFYLIISSNGKKFALAMLLGGAAVAMAVNIRLVLAPVVVMFPLLILIGSGTRRYFKASVFAAGMLLFSLPSLFILLKDTKRFLFDNFGFHLIRNPGFDFPQSLYERLYVIGKMAINPQIFIILIVVITAAVCLWRSEERSRLPDILRRPAGMAGLMAAVLTLIHLLPNPIHQQYFVQALPFVLLATPSGVRFFLDRKQRLLSFISNRGLVGLALTIYVLGIIPYAVVFIGGVRDCDGYAGIGNMKRLCTYLKQAPIKGPVWAEHTIIPILSGRESFAGTEFLGYEYKNILDRERKQFYRLTTNEELTKIIDERQASYCVVLDQPVAELAEVIAANYQPDTTFERFLVYRRK